MLLTAFAVVAVGPPALADGPTDSVGVVDQDTGLWYLRDPTTGGTTSFYYGNPSDQPIVGDWDCDGVDTPGLHRQSDGIVYLRNANTQGIADIRFFFGNPGDIASAGDFNGNGCDTVSIYRPSEGRVFIINTIGENNGGLGAAEFSYYFGNPGDRPFVGDFDGLGAADLSFIFGNPGDKPVVGDWDGDGIDEVGLHRESTGLFYWRNTLDTGVADGQIFFGDPGDRFVAGDWDIVDGIDSPAVLRPSKHTVYFRHTLTQGAADSQFLFGRTDWVPVAGDY